MVDNYQQSLVILHKRFFNNEKELNNLLEDLTSFLDHKHESIKIAYACANNAWLDMSSFPKKIDEMTSNEYEIAMIACELAGSLSFIRKELNSKV